MKKNVFPTQIASTNRKRSADSAFRSIRENFSWTISEIFQPFHGSSINSQTGNIFSPAVKSLSLGETTYQGKMKYLSIIVPALLAVILCVSTKKAAAQPVCSSAYLDNPQNRRLCATLANFFGLPNTLEAYSDEIRPNFGYGLPIGYKGRIPAPDFIENMPGTKRQDVDHVFLRFGRRR